jgi:hypothetical protein
MMADIATRRFCSWLECDLFRSLSCSHCWKSKSKAHGQRSNCNESVIVLQIYQSTSTVVELDRGSLHRYARFVTCRCGLVRIYGYCFV